jgi:hypothetical protein
MPSDPSLEFSGQPAEGAEYQSGVCNIGPDEIARRRQAGHVGVAATVGLLGGLVVIGAPRAVRLSVALPAAVAASGYIQAQLRFCAGFGSRGVFNFGPLGEVSAVTDAEALARDRFRSRQIGLASLAIGLATGALAAALPA